MINEYKFTDAKENLKILFYQTIKDRTPIRIQSDDGNSVYLISETDYNSMLETFYLLKNPKNAQNLIESLNDSNGKRFESLNDLKNETGI